MTTENTRSSSVWPGKGRDQPVHGLVGVAQDNGIAEIQLIAAMVNDPSAAAHKEALVRPLLGQRAFYPP